MADDDERPAEETVPIRKDSLKDAETVTDSSNLGKPDSNRGTAARANVKEGGFYNKMNYDPGKATGRTDGADLYQNTGAGNGGTSPAGSPPKNNETVRIINGVYMHRHPGYPAGATTLSQQRWHPAKQRHRSQSGKDITEQLHLAAGLGRDGLRGAPPMPLSGALAGSVNSARRNSGMILGGLLSAGLSVTPSAIDSLFKLGEAILSGNPMSMASSIASATTETFSAIPAEMMRLKEKYDIPEGVPEETLTSTLIGGLYRTERDAYDKAYTREAEASNAILEAAVDSAVVVNPTTGMTLGDMFPFSHDPDTEWDLYAADVKAAKEAFMSAHPSFDWDSARENALVNMDEDQLRRYAEGLKRRDADYNRALNDLVTQGKVYTLNNDGTSINFGASTDASSLSQKALDEYKIALQIGSSTTSDQMRRLSEKTKAAARDRRAAQAKARQDVKDYNERVAQRNNEVMHDNMLDTRYGMAFRAMYDMKTDVELNDDYMPRSSNTRGKVLQNLQELIAMQDTNNANADAAGVTDLDERKLRFGAYDKASIDAAKDLLHEWSTWHEGSRESSKEMKRQGRSTWLSGVDASKRFLDGFNDLDPNGLPAHLYSVNSYKNKIKNHLSGWDRDAKKGNFTGTELNDGVRSIVASTGSSDIGGIMDALDKVEGNRGLRDRVRDLVRSEAGPGHNAYEYTTLHNHELGAKATSKFLALQNLADKSNQWNMSKDEDEVFQSYMRLLQDQKDGLVQACMSYSAPDKSTGWKGEVYDKKRYYEFMKNCQLLIDYASKKGKVAMPDTFRTDIDGTYFARKIANKEHDDIVAELQSRESDPSFFSGKPMDRVLDAISSADTQTLYSDTELNDAIDDLDEIEGRTPLRTMASTQYLGAMRMLTGMDPFGISTKNMTVGRMSDLSKSLRTQKRIYDDYIAKRRLAGASNLSRDPLALTMETYMDYTAKKMAIATLRSEEGLTRMERRCLDEYEEDLDDTAYRSLVNLDYDTSAMEFSNGMSRPPQTDVDVAMGRIDGMLDERTRETSLQTHMATVKDAALRRAGLARTLESVSMAVDGITSDSDMSKFFAGTSNASKAGMDLKSMKSFFGITNPSAKRSKIMSTYGFSYDNAMDQMAVMALKEAGVNEFSELKTFTPAHLDSITKRLQEKRDSIQENGSLSLSSKLAADKACMSAMNTVACFKGYREAYDMIKDRGAMWVTEKGESMMAPLLQTMDSNFDMVFRQAKKNLWTSNLSNTFDSITLLGDKDVGAVSAAAVACSAAGVEPSLGQGHMNIVNAASMRQSIADMFLKRSTNRVALSSFVGAGKAFTASPVLVFTSGGAYNAYGSGSVATMSNKNILNQITLPLGMYNVLANLLYGDRMGAADKALLGNMGDTSFRMNPESWNNEYGKGLHAVDVSLLAIKTKDQDGNDVYSKIFAPIVKEKGEYRLVRTWDPNDLVGFTENDILDRFGGKVTGIVDKKGVDRLHPAKAESIKASSAEGPVPWSGDSISKTVNPGAYLQNSSSTLYEAYGVSIAGGRIINNILYPYGIKGNAVVCLVNRTKDAVVCDTRSDVITYISRRFGEIRCEKYVQTLGGARVDVTMPWEDIKISPPCPFYGLLDVYVPWAKDGFKDPRVMEEAKKTVSTFVEAAEATAMIRDFGGFDDTPTIEADPMARGIRNVLMRAHAKVGAYSKSVFDALYSKADSLPKVTLSSYRDVLRSAYFLAREVGIGPCDSHGAWHLIKGIRSNIILAIDANPFMQYRQAYATSRPEVDAIAYIGTGMDAAEKEKSVKDLFMLIGAMAACERPPLPDFVPGFYDDSKSEWEDAVDYWYVMLHHPDAPGPEPEPEEEPSEEEGEDESGTDEESS